jgi:hypothetical protein
MVMPRCCSIIHAALRGLGLELAVSATAEEIAIAVAGGTRS